MTRDRVEVVLVALLPGALAGTQIAGLLFFLNPHLPFAAGPVFRAVVFYGALLGLISLVLHLPFVWNRRDRARAILPWTLTSILALSAVFALIHASRYAYFLPSGINRRLVKLGVLLAVSAAVAFYTALLHSIRRRPYGRGSKALLGLLAALSIYFALERREAFRPTPPPSPRATTAESSLRPRLLIVGLETATLDAILPLAEIGRLPFFARMLQEGSYGRVRPLMPVRRTPLWTTLATGKHPHRHGVVDDRLFAAPFATDDAALHLLPLAMHFDGWGSRALGRPLDARAIQVLTLWRILARLDVTTGVLGWPLAAPADDTLSILLSERYFDGSEDPADVAPAEIGARGRLFRPRIEEIDPDLRASFGDRPPAVVLRSLARDLWRESLAEFLLVNRPELEALFLLLPGLEAVSRHYPGDYDTVHFTGAQGNEIEQAAQLLAAYYGHLDAALADLWATLPQPRLLIVVSAYGDRRPRGWHELRRVLTRQQSFRDIVRHSPSGVLMMLGDSIQQGAMLDSVELVDLMPTLLYGLGFPIAEDLDGTVLTRAFDTTFLARHALTFVPSYETFAPREGPGADDR